ncbi:uncharacterized protein LOC142086035 [Calonectris borealis]|uniref:uncharacterized protein LOC142086035 n=1 Tax=Calonectris borealis TaxID=1323832 RepID=UPI003F4B6B15
MPGPGRRRRAPWGRSLPPARRAHASTIARWAAPPAAIIEPGRKEGPQRRGAGSWSAPGPQAPRSSGSPRSPPAAEPWERPFRRPFHSQSGRLRPRGLPAPLQAPGPGHWLRFCVVHGARPAPPWGRLPEAAEQNWGKKSIFLQKRRRGAGVLSVRPGASGPDNVLRCRAVENESAPATGYSDDQTLKKIAGNKPLQALHDSSQTDTSEGMPQSYQHWTLTDAIFYSFSAAEPPSRMNVQGPFQGKKTTHRMNSFLSCLFILHSCTRQSWEWYTEVISVI